MDFFTIPDDKGGKYHISATDDYEFVNPLSKFGEFFILQNIQFYKNIIRTRLESQGGPKIPESVWMRVFIKNSLEDWEKRKQEYLEAEVPQSLWNVLSAVSKKEQIKTLRGLELSFQDFNSFVCQAGEKLGYTYSFYKADFQRNGLDISKLPSFVYLRKNNKVETAGRKTELSLGQLKQAITDRKVIVARFLDKEDEWHCFFYTYKSIAGQENYQGEQPHAHYISSKWGIPRADIVSAIKSGTYRSTPVHIKLTSKNQESDEEE